MATNSLNFTKEIIEKIIPPKAEKDSKGKIIRPKIVQHVYTDIKEKGLVLNVSYLGTKSFFLSKKINSTAYKIKLGSFPNKLHPSPDDISIAEVRTKAGELKNQLAKGINLTLPKTQELQQEKPELTFKGLFGKYINDYAIHNTKSWEIDIAEMNNKAGHLYPKNISSITRDDIQEIFNNITITGKPGANRFLDRLNAVFNKAIKWGFLDKNPGDNVIKHKLKERDRYLLAEEKPRFLAAVYS